MFGVRYVGLAIVVGLSRGASGSSMEPMDAPPGPIMYSPGLLPSAVVGGPGTFEPAVMSAPAVAPVLSSRSCRAIRSKAVSSLAPAVLTLGRETSHVWSGLRRY